MVQQLARTALCQECAGAAYFCGNRGIPLRAPPDLCLFNLNNRSRATEFENASLEEIVLKSSGVFNNAARRGTIPSTGTACRPMAAASRAVALARDQRRRRAPRRSRSELAKVAIGTFVWAGAGWSRMLTVRWS